MPCRERLTDHISECSAVLDFPQAVGALEGCHFPVSPPKDKATDYYNYKGWHSVILLALVDHKYKFRFVRVVTPGRCHNAYVYEQSNLAEFVESPEFQSPVANISGTPVGPLILCDQAFALTSHLNKPFSHRAHLDDEMKELKYRLSKAKKREEW
ncbi:uncharacterized protein LOC144095595 [Amblyomma americanum]